MTMRTMLSFAFSRVRIRETSRESIVLKNISVVAIRASSVHVTSAECRDRPCTGRVASPTPGLVVRITTLSGNYRVNLKVFCETSGRAR
jgi:hypothetical protein